MIAGTVTSSYVTIRDLFFFTCIPHFCFVPSLFICIIKILFVLHSPFFKIYPFLHTFYCIPLIVFAYLRVWVWDLFIPLFYTCIPHFCFIPILLDGVWKPFITYNAYFKGCDICFCISEFFIQCNPCILRGGGFTLGRTTTVTRQLSCKLAIH